MNKNKKNIYYVMAGEASGDLHGSYLIKAIQLQDPYAVFYGVGGKKMVASGLISFVSIKHLSVMGFWEVFKKLFFFLSLQKKILKDINVKKPKKIILIDYPGFNLRLAKKIKKRYSVTIVYYISPQLWAWKEKRIKYIKKYVDEMIVFFPFEKKWYAKRGLSVSFFGHPLTEIYSGFLNTKTNSKKRSVFNIALFLGSRNQEVVKHLSLFKDIVFILSDVFKDVVFTIKKGPEISRELLVDFEKIRNCTITNERSFSVFDSADFAVVVSGTATLECGITNTPQVVVYKTSFLSWFIMRWFLKVKHASIINILGGKLLVKEFLQKQATASNISKHIEVFRKRGASLDLTHVIDPLKGDDIYGKTARHIVRLK